jgi:hypothetical protein
MRPGRLLLLCVAVLAAGCGGSRAGSGGQPAEDPGHAMQRLVRHELAGQLGSSYAMLVREQQKAVSHDLYVHCPPGQPRTDVTVKILGVSDQLFDVPVLGKVDTKAVRYEMSIPDANGQRMRVADTGHLIAQDGQWRWTLSQQSLSALLAGACP